MNRNVVPTLVLELSRIYDDSKALCRESKISDRFQQCGRCPPPPATIACRIIVPIFLETYSRRDFVFRISGPDLCSCESIREIYVQPPGLADDICHRTRRARPQSTRRTCHTEIILLDYL